MADYTQEDYQVFQMFQKQWAVVAAGTPDNLGCCTVSWGSLGTLWTRPGCSGSTVTVYLYPTRHTREIMMQSETFTVSFFPKDQRRALAYLGSHSGHDGNKVDDAGLTPVALGESTGFEEAELTFACRKVYQGPLAKEGLAPEVQDYYAANPKVYPVTDDGEWEPHWIFIGEITEVFDKRQG